MKTLGAVVKNLKEYYGRTYQFTIFDDTIVITSEQNYKDLKAWHNLEYDITHLLDRDSGVESYDMVTPFEVGVNEWNKDLCYIQFSVNFYEKH
jgi:hypothetical protein